MGGFLGIGGSSAKTDRNVQLQALGNLGNVFNYAIPQAESKMSTGTATTGTGTSAINNSLNYWQKLMGGNRTALQTAIAPERNAMLAGADAARRQQATMGTNRGGGVTSTNQQQQTDVMSQINNELFGAQTEAAKETGQLGVAEGNLGLGEQAEASNLLGLGTNAQAEIANNAADSRAQDYLINQNQQQHVIGAILGGLGGFFQ